MISALIGCMCFIVTVLVNFESSITYIYRFKKKLNIYFCLSWKIIYEKSFVALNKKTIIQVVMSCRNF